jgi:hypothetical protein
LIATMIKYALQCEKGHGFESWFSDSAGYDMQRKRGLVDCPVCGSRKIEKQIMSPRVRVKKGDSGPLVAPVQETPSESSALMAEGPLGEEAKKFRAMLKEFHEHVKANTEDVGGKFADEARKIHYGETEERAIRGRASADEAQELYEEGIGFLPLPPLPDERN